MGRGQGHWHIFGWEQFMTCNVQRGDQKTFTNLLQTIPNPYNMFHHPATPSGRTLFMVWYLRQRLRIKVQSCPVLR